MPRRKIRLKNLPEGERHSIEKDLFAGALALAGRNATIPFVRKRAVRRSERICPTKRTARVLLSASTEST